MAIYTLEQYKADVVNNGIYCEAILKDSDLTLFDIPLLEISYYIQFAGMLIADIFGSIVTISEHLGYYLRRLQNLLIEIRQKKEELSYLSSENSRCKQAVEKHINHCYGNTLENYQHSIECILILIESRERVELKNKQNNV